MIKVLPLPVAIQKASFFRSASTNFSSDGTSAPRELTRKSFQGLQQVRPVVETAVQENLRIERGKVLKVFEFERRPARADRAQVDAQVVVVPLQVISRDNKLSRPVTSGGGRYEFDLRRQNPRPLP